MKITPKKSSALVAQNITEVQAWAETSLRDTPYFPLVLLIADMFDAIAKDEQAYMVIGATSNRTSYSVTLNVNGGKDSRYAEGLAGLATGAADWLDAPKKR